MRDPKKDNMFIESEIGDIKGTSSKKPVIHHEYVWKSFDNKDLYGQSWQPQNKTPRSVILLVHGLGDHSGRYDEWAEMFVQEDIAVCAIDYRGNGRSFGKRGHARKLEFILRDIDVLLHEAKAIFPKIPVLLYGHSLGGSLVINYYLSREVSIEGMIVSSPWLSLSKQPTFLQLLLMNPLRKIYPSALFKTGVHCNELSQVEEIHEHYRKDELSHNKISVKMYTDANAAGENAKCNVFKINIPMLLMHGVDDKITSAKASEEFVRNTGEYTKFKSWPTSSHELHKDANYINIHKYILSWIEYVGL